MSIEQQLKDVIKNEPLWKHTTFKIGGPAKYFFVARSSDELVRALEIACQEKIPFYILGGGSNVLVSDKGFNGLVIKIKNEKLKIKNDKEQFKIIELESGVLLGKVVIEAARDGLSGLEWAVGIPGTIGGAVRGNAGAYGHSINELIKKVNVLEIQELVNTSILRSIEVLTFSQEECGFGYRDSVFKKNKNLIILEVELNLTPRNKEEIQQKMADIIRQRRQKTPPYPSPGSFFKNCELEITSYELLRKRFYQANDSDITKWLEWKKIPAAWFIDQCGLKGKQIGEAKISESHANFIVNTGKARAEDVIMLASLIKQQVRDKFGVQLGEEIEYVGF